MMEVKEEGTVKTTRKGKKNDRCNKDQKEVE
jgi:hypothetical protein